MNDNYVVVQALWDIARTALLVTLTILFPFVMIPLFIGLYMFGGWVVRHEEKERKRLEREIPLTRKRLGLDP